jgi:hypothetical protein
METIEKNVTGVGNVGTAETKKKRGPRIGVPRVKTTKLGGEPYPRLGTLSRPGIEDFGARFAALDT